MLCFSHLDKSQKDSLLPELFAILEENTILYAPGEMDYAQWFSNVSPALEKASRQILLCRADGILSGFLQYYTRRELLMIEELQLKKAYQRTTLFYLLCSHLAQGLPAGIRCIEAYADKRNLPSQRLMRRLGMVPLEEDGSPFVHLRGTAEQAKRLFGKGGRHHVPL